MDTIKITEKFELIIRNHPYADSFNKRLLEEILELQYVKNPVKSNITGKKSSDFDGRYAKTLTDWIQRVIKQHYPWDFSTKLNGSWIADYGIDDYAVSHDHTRHGDFSFVYFINTPSGSSPLVFTTSDVKIEAVAGRLVIFPGNVLHHVPKNKCERRVTAAGNIIFRGG